MFQSRSQGLNINTEEANAILGAANSLDLNDMI